MSWIIPVGLRVSFTGSIIASVDLQNAGYAEVDGFLSLPILSAAHRRAMSAGLLGIQRESRECGEITDLTRTVLAAVYPRSVAFLGR
jgi:hypothetical protein